MTELFKYKTDGVQACIEGALEHENVLGLVKLCEDVVGLLEPPVMKKKDRYNTLFEYQNMSEQDAKDIERLFKPSQCEHTEQTRQLQTLYGGQFQEKKLANLYEQISVLEASLPSGRLYFTRDQAQGFSQALNDIRMVISARLSINTDEDAEKVSDFSYRPAGFIGSGKGVVHHLMSVYNFLTWIQDSVMEALLDVLDDDIEHRLIVESNPDNFEF